MPCVTVWLRPKRIADREHHIAGAQFVGAAHRHDRQILEIDAQDGQVGVRIGADDRRGRDAAIGKLHADLVGALDHVMVGDEVTRRHRR